jgi:hypothetical protein
MDLDSARAQHRDPAGGRRVPIGQHDIQHHEIGLVPRVGCEAVSQARGVTRLEARRLQGVEQRIRECGVIFHEKHGCHGGVR